MRQNGPLLWLAFAVAIAVTFMAGTWFPWLHLCPFAPFLVMAYYSRSFLNCLWLSLCCGLFMDLLAAERHLGIYALTYYLTTLILFTQRRFFFEDKFSTLPLMTALFSAISTTVLVITLYFMGNGVPFSWGWVVRDLVLMSVLDGLYAFTCFQLPMLLWKRRPQRKEELAVKRPQ